MLIYQQIVLLIISSANIIFAENFFQSVYEERSLDPSASFLSGYYTTPVYIPPTLVKDYSENLALERQAQKQLFEELKKLFSKPNPETREENPVYAAIARSSNLVGYPQPHHHYPYYHNYISKKPIDNLHYVKLKSHEYVQPSIFVAHPNSLAAHYRRKRSTDFTDVKSNKSTIDDVATKPSLIDTKDSTVIDSLLPENKSKNDKHVRTRQSDFEIKPFLFGLDPSKMSKRQAKSLDNLDGKKDETLHSVSKHHHTSLNTPVFFTQSTPDSTKATVTEPAAQTAQQTFQEKEQYQEPSHTNENPQFILNVSSTNFEQPSSSITTSQRQLLEGGEPIDGQPNCKLYKDGSKTWTICHDPTPITVPWRPHQIWDLGKSQRNIQLPEGGKPIDGQPNCKSYNNGTLILCIRDKKIIQLSEDGKPQDDHLECKYYSNGSVVYGRICYNTKVITVLARYSRKPAPSDNIHVPNPLYYIMRNGEMYPNTKNNMEQSSSSITTSQRDVAQLPEGGKPIEGRPNCKSYNDGSVIRCKQIIIPYKTKEEIWQLLNGRNAEMYPNTRKNMEQSSSSITTSQRNVQLPEGGKPIDGRPKCKSYNDGSLILCISDKKIKKPYGLWYSGRQDPFDRYLPNYIMRNAKMYPNTRNNMD